MIIMKFEIDRVGLSMIANYFKEMNLEGIINVETDRVLIHLFDTAKARALIIEYPARITEGEPQSFATKSEWLFDKVKLMKSAVVVCEVTETHLILRQDRTIKDVRMLQQYDIVLLDPEEGMVSETTFPEEPKPKSDVFCELPDVSIVQEAIIALDTDTFYISAKGDQLLLESEEDYEKPASTITLFTPSVVKDEDNRTCQDRKQIAGFLGGLTGTKVTSVAFSKEGVMVTESTGENIRIKLISAPIVE